LHLYLASLQHILLALLVHFPMAVAAGAHFSSSLYLCGNKTLNVLQLQKLHTVQSIHYSTIATSKLRNNWGRPRKWTGLLEILYLLWTGKSLLFGSLCSWLKWKLMWMTTKMNHWQQTDVH